MQDNEHPWTELSDGTAVRVYYAEKDTRGFYRVDRRRKMTPEELTNPGMVRRHPPITLERVFQHQDAHSLVSISFLTLPGAKAICEALVHLLATHHPHRVAPAMIDFGAYTEIRYADGARQAVQWVLAAQQRFLVGSVQTTTERGLTVKELAEGVPERDTKEWIAPSDTETVDGESYIVITRGLRPEVACGWQAQLAHLLYAL